MRALRRKLASAVLEKEQEVRDLKRKLEDTKLELEHTRETVI